VFVVFFLLNVAAIVSWMQRFGPCENRTETGGSILDLDLLFSTMPVTSNKALQRTRIGRELLSLAVRPRR
jgi:hypothetical protein